MRMVCKRVIIDCLSGYLEGTRHSLLQNLRVSSQATLYRAYYDRTTKECRTMDSGDATGFTLFYCIYLSADEAMTRRRSSHCNVRTHKCKL